ncbi:MAG: hypothetical protein IJE04_05325 [Bacilli bacterium]|nr:hypothetical protein [Bacilli bacterium]
MYKEIEYERLRSDLMDYYGTAMCYNPMAAIELNNVENASNSKLEQIALQNSFDLNNYIE